MAHRSLQLIAAGAVKSLMNECFYQAVAINSSALSEVTRILSTYPLIQKLKWLGSLFVCSDDGICHRRGSDEILAKQTTFRVTVMSSKFLELCPKGLCIDAPLFSSRMLDGIPIG